MDATESHNVAPLALDPVERWNIFNRLQELSIPCRCVYGQPLFIDVSTASAAVQVWSVVQRSVATRDDMITYLERCWRKLD